MIALKSVTFHLFEAEYYIIYIIDGISRNIIILRNGGYFWVAISAKFPLGIQIRRQQSTGRGKMS